MESRWLGNLHVRFGERGAETTCREAGRRCAPTLLSGLFGPRLSRPRWRCKDRGRSTLHPLGRNEVEGGRERLSWTARNANLFAGEESCGWPLRDGDRDEVVLRSHQVHRGLRGRAPLQSSKEHRSWPGVHRRSPTATAVMAPLSHDGSRLHGPPCPSIPHRRPIRIMSMTNALVGADRMAALPSRAYPRTSG
jgi:hypothetical protein